MSVDPAWVRLAIGAVSGLFRGTTDFESFASCDGCEVVGFAWRIHCESFLQFMDKLDRGFPTSLFGAVALVMYLCTSCTNSFFATPMRNGFLQLTCIKDSHSLANTLAKLFHFVLACIVALCFVLIIQRGKPVKQSLNKRTRQ